MYVKDLGSDAEAAQENVCNRIHPGNHGGTTTKFVGPTANGVGYAEYRSLVLSFCSFSIG